MKRQILRILSGHRGASRRISRASLLAELRLRLDNVSDREMRLAIEELRRGHAHGAWLCADLRGGYFMAEDEEELERYLASDERRANKLLERVHSQRRMVSLQNSRQMALLTADEGHDQD